jgi:1-phosphofructokinase
MIYTVTLNPSLDRTLSVPELNPGDIHRARLVREDLGGKGVNVSRSLRALGIPSRILGFAGGDASFVEVGAEIRQNITLLNEGSGQYTKINELGPEIEAQHISALEEQIDRIAQPGDLWAFCGSLPPGAPPDLYARLICQVQNSEGLAFLDTSGAALRLGMSARPFCIKINAEEVLEVLHGKRREGGLNLAGVAGALQEGATRLVVLTRGAQGLVLALEDQRLVAVPPEVAARSSVGAGDASLAGLLWGITENCDPAMLARRAAACGTAAAMQEGSGVGDAALVRDLLEKVEVHPG